MTPGYFGKVRSRGDFVRSGLPDEFVSAWDAWIQRGIVAARAQGLGSFCEWDPAHVAVRFTVDAGWLGDSAWCGVVSTSADRVGRSFPLVLARTLDTPPTDAASLLALDATLTRFADALVFAQRESRIEPFAAALEAIANGAADVPGADEDRKLTTERLIERLHADARAPRISWWGPIGDDDPLCGSASLPPEPETFVAMLAAIAGH